jgi:hypothetical protein
LQAFTLARMSELGNKRRMFSKMLVRLCLEAERLGYEYSFEYTKRCESCPIGHPQSTHNVGLAADLNLYKRNSDGELVYIRTGEGHDQLHDYWDHIGGAERIENDANHYSLEWQGVR